MAQCHDCGVEEGKTHLFGCDMEECPFCGEQILSCSCVYQLLGYNFDSQKPLAGLPLQIYENGLPPEKTNEWIEILNKKGRIPWIQYPLICAHCGKLWPDFFIVPNEEWEKYIPQSQKHIMLCPECYAWIKQTIDNEQP